MRVGGWFEGWWGGVVGGKAVVEGLKVDGGGSHGGVEVEVW